MKKIRTSAFVMITSPNGDVIMLKRRDAAKAGKSKIYVPGVYSLPGGVIEENEDPFAAVQRENFEETGILLNRAQLATAGVFRGKDVTTYFYCYKATEREYSDIYSTIDRAFKTFALGNFEDGSYPPEFAEHTGVTSMKAWHVYALGKERQISYGLTDDGSPMHFQRMLVLPADIIVYTLLKEYGDFIMGELHEKRTEIIRELQSALHFSVRKDTQRLVADLTEFSKEAASFPGVDGDLDIFSHNTQTEFRYR